MPTNVEIRDFLIEHFNRSELDTFCHDHFRAVYENNEGTGIEKDVYARRLVEYCERRGLMNSLLAAMQKERPESFSQCFAAVKIEPVSIRVRNSNVERPVDVFIRRGDNCFRNGDRDRAIECYDDAIRVEPDEADAYHHRGWAYYKMMLYDRAIEDFNQAIRLGPESTNPYHFGLDLSEAYHNRGLAYKAKGDREGAIADFKKYLELCRDIFLRLRAVQALEELGARP